MSDRTWTFDELMSRLRVKPPVMDRAVVANLQALSRLATAGLWTAMPWWRRADIWLGKHRRSVAAAVSLGLHGLVLALLVMGVAARHDGGAGSANAGSIGGYGVDLVAFEAPALQAFKTKAATPADDVELTALDAATVTTDTAVTPPSLTPLATTDTTPTEPATAAGSEGSGGRAAGANDSLWKQIEPCWRRLAGSGTSDVTLRVDFSALGNIAQTSGAADPRSQATAVEALAECGPYVSVASQQAVVIAFPKPRTGA